VNIGLFTPSFLPRIGGMEVVVDKLARAFGLLGHEVLVLAKTPRDPWQRPDLPYKVVYYPRTRSSTFLLGPVHRALRREHQRRRFDVIHSHFVYPTGYVAVRHRRRAGVPVVVTSHAGDIVPESMYRRKWIADRRIRWTLRQADAATGVSAELKRLIDELSDGRANSVVIPNGVDLPAERSIPTPARFAHLAAGPFLLTLGRLHPLKGLDVLLSAMAILKRRGQAPRLVIAGDGDIRQELEAMSRQLGLADTVSFVGMVGGDDKDWLLSQAQLFVQPSRREGMPLTVREAMAFGKPVLATDIGGTRDLVRGGHNGLLVPPDDPAALAEGLVGLSQDARLGELARNASATAQAMSWPSIAGQYLTLFESLLARGPRD
jgi:glycosyltransferase involved in cell wall biosynthesis